MSGDRVDTTGSPGRLAAAVSEALAGVERGRVRVDGAGPLATELRALLGAELPEPARPLAVVETTGTADGLRAACEQVADRGLVLLAAEADEPVDMDVYRDVHRRGLELLGVPDASSRAL
jgi:hypothetical protein